MLLHNPGSFNDVSSEFSHVSSCHPIEHDLSRAPYVVMQRVGSNIVAISVWFAGHVITNIKQTAGHRTTVFWAILVSYNVSKGKC